MAWIYNRICQAGHYKKHYNNVIFLTIHAIEEADALTDTPAITGCYTLTPHMCGKFFMDLKYV